MGPCRFGISAECFRLPHWMLWLHAHTSTCSCLSFTRVFLGFDQFWLCFTCHAFTHVFSTYLQPCVCPEGTVSQRTHTGCVFYCILDFCTYILWHLSAFFTSSTVDLPFDICDLFGISCSSEHLTSNQEQLFSLCLSDT